MIKVLQVVTLVGNTGQYGGPVTVARTIQSYFDRFISFNLRIIAGVIEIPVLKNESEKLVKVRRTLPKKSVSSLFSLKMAFALIKEIKQSNVIHLHFARDAIQIFAGFMAIFFKKPFVTQTHGMIRQKSNILICLFDTLFIKPILRKAEYNLVLTTEEQKELEKIDRNLKFQILHNGIKFESKRIEKESEKYVVIFCARLHKTKGIDKFIELAKEFELIKKIKFVIYGPDGGELTNLLAQIKNKDNISYAGSLKAEEVKEVLKKSDLLVSPSNYDPFPMIVIEALSLGLPVLISGECGHSNLISQINRDYIVSNNAPFEYSKKLRKLIEENMHRNLTSEILESSKRIFDFENIYVKLGNLYEEVIKSEKY